MYLYTDEGKRKKYDTTSLIGCGHYGDVYKLPNEECIKIYKGKNLNIDKEILIQIKNLLLDNYYEIYDLLYTKSSLLKGYTMKYYQNEDIDILTMPVEYTLDNLFKLSRSVEKLTENQIFISDMHTGNIIVNSSKITVIDTDLYTFNRFLDYSKLKTKNISALECLFREIYLEAVNKYHKEYIGYDTSQMVKELFRPHNYNIPENTCKKLSKFKYPIDYIKTRKI